MDSQHSNLFTFIKVLTSQPTLQKPPRKGCSFEELSSKASLFKHKLKNNAKNCFLRIFHKIKFSCEFILHIVGINETMD